MRSLIPHPRRKPTAPTAPPSPSPRPLSRRQRLQPATPEGKTPQDRRRDKTRSVRPRTLVIPTPTTNTRRCMMMAAAAARARVPPSPPASRRPRPLTQGVRRATAERRGGALRPAHPLLLKGAAPPPRPPRPAAPPRPLAAGCRRNPGSERRHDAAGAGGTRVAALGSRRAPHGRPAAGRGGAGGRGRRGKQR